MRLQRLRVAAILPMHDAQVVQHVRLSRDVAASFVQPEAALVVIDGHPRIAAQGGHRPKVLVCVRTRVVGARPFGPVDGLEQGFPGMLIRTPLPVDLAQLQEDECLLAIGPRRQHLARLSQGF